MKASRSSSIPWAGGTTKLFDLYYLSSAAFVYIAVLNILDCIADGSGFLDYILYGGIILLLVPLALLFKKFKKYKWNAFVFALIGLGILIDNNPQDHPGVVFIIFSLAIYSTIITNIILFSIMGFIIVAKNIDAGMGITYTLNMFVIYTFIFLVYYKLFYLKFHPKTAPAPIVVFCPQLDATDVKIVEKLYQSYIHKEIAPVVNLSKDAVSRRISRMYKKLDVASSAELVTKCLHMGYIAEKVDK